MKRYLDKILFPYITTTKAKYKLDATQSALVTFDTFHGQCTERILSKLEENNVHVVIIPVNCTDRLQPLDLSVNKAVRDFLHTQFSDWYADRICNQLCRGVKPAKSVDLQLSIVKPLGARWMLALRI